jgi:hypothetical protein
MQTALTPMLSSRRLPKRHASGLTTPMPIGIALAMVRSLFAHGYLPVLKALQGHPKAGALWEKHINKILNDPDIVYTTHERSIYRGKIDGKIVLLCLQVDDLAVACSDPSVAQGLIDSIGKIVDLKSQGILSSFNGIDIDQRREYVKVSCQSYLARVAGTNLLRPIRSSRLLRLPPKSSLLIR